MNYPPFETWIIENTPRSAEQEQQLQDHLRTCPQCCQLAEGWSVARTHLRNAGLAAPQPGFTNRWQSSLAARLAYHQQMQTRRTMLGFGSAVALLFLILLVRLVWNASPVDWLVTLINTVLLVLTDLHALQQAALTWFNAVPLSIPITLWISFSVGWQCW